MWLFLCTWLVLAILAAWFFSRLKRLERWMVEEQERREKVREWREAIRKSERMSPRQRTERDIKDAL